MQVTKTSKPLKILFRLGPFPMLSETFVMSQIEGLIAQGHEVSVLAENLSSDIELITSPEILQVAQRAVFLQPKSAWFSAFLQKLPYRVRQKRRQLAERKAYKNNDVVVCNFGWMGIEAANQMKDMPQRAKLVTIFHGADMSSFLKGRDDSPYADLFAIGDSFLPISQFWKSKLLELGAPEEKTSIHRMGVFTDEFSFSSREKSSDNPFNFITVGRLTEKKGVEYTIRAAAALKQMLDKPNFQVTIIGDGPLKTELKILCHDLGMDAEISFKGALPHEQVAKHLQKADAFLLPSVTAQNGDMEGIPVALMEAMASGLPVISTRHSGIPELVIHDNTGLLADERDPQGLAQAMHQTLTDHTNRETLASSARKHVETEFNNALWNQKLGDLCLQIANQSPVTGDKQ